LPVVGITGQHQAALDLLQRAFGPRAVMRETRRVGAVGEMRLCRLDGLEHPRRVTDGYVVAARIAAPQRAIDDDQPRQPVGMVGGEENRQSARHRMAQHDRAPPAEMRADGQNVAHEGIQRIILGVAPARPAETAMVEGHHLAVAGKPGGHPDPVVGIEVVAAMQDQDRRGARCAERAGEQADIA